MKEHAIPDKLLLRRPMRPDEWGESYLADLIRLNGVLEPKTQLVDRVRSSLPWYPVPGRPSVSVDRFSLESPISGRPEYGNRDLPRWATLHRRTAPRYCPLCMVESRYIRTRWRISMLPICTLHGCYLKKELADPALTVKHKNLGLRSLFEASDEQLMEGAVCCLPAELAVARMVWEPLERAAEACAQPHADSALAERAGWTVVAWHLLGRVANIHRLQTHRQAGSNALSNITNFMAAGRARISPSQQGVRAFVLDITDRAQCRAIAQCLRALIAHDCNKGCVLSRASMTELYDALQAASPQMAARSTHYERQFREEGVQALRRQHAIDYLGIGKTEFDGWMKKLLLPNVTVFKTGKHQFKLFGRADLKQAKHYWHSLISVEDFLAEQNIDLPIYQALCNQRILKPEKLGHRHYLRRRDLSTLACRLELICRPAAKQGTNRRYPLFGAITFPPKCRAETIGAFVHAALEGRFPVYRCLHLPGLSSFYVGDKGLAWIHNCAAAGRTRSVPDHRADQPEPLHLPA